MFKIRSFENKHLDLKMEAVGMWRDGESIASIARHLGKSRETIYRWVKKSERVLTQSSKRNRITELESAKNEILEVYFLLGYPSIRQLQSVLNILYLKKFSQNQLRRALARWKIKKRLRTKAFNLLMKHLVAAQFDLKRVFDDFRGAEISPISAGDSSRPFV